MQLDHVAFMRKSDMRYWLIWFRERVEIQCFIRQRANVDLIESFKEKM